MKKSKERRPGSVQKAPRPARETAQADRESEPLVASLMRLNEASARLWQTQDLQKGLEEMLAATMQLLRADFGNIQLFDPKHEVLHIAVHRGFKRSFLEHFHEVSAKDGSACSRALRTGRRILIADVNKDKAYAKHREIARSAGYRAVQFTPLIARDGRPLGIISTHFRLPHRLGDLELQSLDIYVRRAADFIERCGMEQALREREDKLRLALDAARAGTWSWNAKTQEASWDDRFHALYDFARHRPRTFSNWMARIHKDDQARVLAEIKKVRKQPANGGWDIEFRSVRTDGAIVWHHGLGHAVCDAKGKLVRLDGIDTDITARKQAEELLQQREKQLSLIVRHYPGMVARVDRDLRYHYVSPRYEEWFGVPASAIMGRKMADVIGPQAYARAEPFVQRALAGEQVTFDNQITLSSGRSWWVKATFVPVTDGDGAVPGLFIFATDITARKEVEAVLRASEEKYRCLFENMTEMFQILEPIFNHQGKAIDFRYIEVNPATATLTGLTRKEIEGKTARKLWHKVEPYWIEMLGEVLRTGRPAQLENYRQELDKFYDVKAWKLDDRRVAIVVSNVTERKRAEDALSESEANLHKFINTAATGLVLNTRDLRYQSVNEAYARLVSLPADQIVGRTLVEVLGKKAMNKIRPYVERVLRGQRVEYETELPLITTGPRWIHVVYTPDRNAAGKIVGWVGSITDITQRKRIEEALREHEARLRLAAAAGNVGLWDWDLRTNAVYFSPEWKRQIGHREDEITNHFDEWQSRVHPDDLGPALKKIRTFLKAPKKPHEAEFRFRHKDGRYLWIYTRAEVVHDAKGNPVRMLGCHIDITARKQAEEAQRELNATLEQRVSERTAALVESEGRYRRLYDSLHDAFVRVEMKGRILEFNSAYAHMLGYTPEELRGMTYFDVTPRKWHRIESRIVREQILPNGFSGVYEKEYRRKDGTIFPVELRTFLIRDPSGKPHEMWAIVRDITARKHSESQLRELNATLEKRVYLRTQELRQREERLRSILNTVVDAIITIDARGNITGVNPATERMFGYTEAEMTGQNVKMLMPSPFRDEHDGYLRNYHHTGHAKIIGVGREAQAVRKDGTIFPVELAVSEVDHMHTYTGVIRDITDRRKLEREILNISESERAAIGRDLHDDLGQQLAGIWLICDSIKGSLEAEGSPETRNAAKVTDLLKNALALTRSLARGLHPVAVQGGGIVAALNDLVDRTRDIFRIDCRCQCPQVLPMENSTATHLYRIAQEAVTNAVKHADAKRIDIELTADQNAISLSVKDDGKGKGTSIADPARGGMGIRIMRYRADMIGGHLDIKHGMDGCGTTVRCALPAAHAQSSTN